MTSTRQNHSSAAARGLIERTSRRTWAKMLGLLLVPLLVAGVVLAIANRHDDNLGKVSGAIVNLDQAVQINGQTVPMGRQLSAALVDRDDANIDWVLADAASGEEGLDSGEYAVLVTIPANFSAAATSYSKTADQAHQATIDIRTSDASSVADAVVARQIAEQASTALNSTLTSGYLENIYVGFNTMGEQLTTMANGAAQLSSGASQLAAGVGSAADGAQQAGSGMAQLDTAGAELATGATALAAGAGQLSTGVTKYTDGVAQLGTGITQLSGGLATLDSKLSGASGGMSSEQQAQLGQLKTGAAQVASGAAGLSSGLGTYQATLDQWAAGKNLPAQFTTALAKQSGAAVTQCKVQGAEQVTATTVAIKQQIDDGITKLPAQADASMKSVTEQQVSTALAGYQQEAAGVVNKEVADAVADALVERQILTDEQAKGVAAQVAAAVATPVSKDVVSGITTQVNKGLGTELASLLTTALQTQVDSGFEQVQGQISDQVATQLDGMCGQIGAAVTQSATGGFSGAAQAASTALSYQDPESGQSLRSGATALASGAGQLSTGVAQLVDGLPAQIASQMKQLSDGVGKLADGAAQLDSGAKQLTANSSQLTSGASQLASGATTLAGGVTQYAGGVHQARVGIEQLASGMGQLDDGSTKLASGMKTFADGVAKGSTQVPSYTQSEREQLAKVVAQPVEGDQRIVTPLAATTALIDVLALWLGALATYLLVRPISRHAVSSSRSSAALLAAALAPGAAVTTVQALVLGLVSGGLLDLSAGSTAKLTAVLAISGLAFVALNHALAAWWGQAGRAVATLLAVLTGIVGITTAVPSALTALEGFSPLHPALAGIRGAIAEGPGVTGAIGMALFWGMLALALGHVAVARSRQLKASQVAVRRAD
ncbi:YhgE/Pip family protein [Luteococcus sanguinis]|uniref:YhgE/Pip domain-containing protein n=1 Tax=Luteococcus sanguinis TaxID=174038 RepID=A0ABW1X263_9ACTN